MELPSDVEDSDDDCIILEAKSDEEQGQGCNNSGEDCSSVVDVQCDAECCRMEEVLCRPYQVRDGNILMETKKLQGKKWRQFIPNWYQLYTCLFLCIRARKAFCYCRWCSKKGLISSSTVNRAFVSRGFDNWKKGHECFKQHSKSVSHREAMMKIGQMNSPTIDAQLSCQVKQAQDLHFKHFWCCYHL